MLRRIRPTRHWDDVTPVLSGRDDDDDDDDDGMGHSRGWALFSFNATGTTTGC
jgi:hypothetical protein